MRALAALVAAAILPAIAIGEEADKRAIRALAAHIGKEFWSAPQKRLVRATTYQKGKHGVASDSSSRKGQEKIGLRYATAKGAGTLAVPKWLPRGSMVRIRTERGVRCYIAADEGPAVDSRRAATHSGKTKEQRAATVLDFCATEQLWPDFVVVDIFYYAGKVAFNDLSFEDQKTLFACATDYASRRQ